MRNILAMCVFLSGAVCAQPGTGTIKAHVTDATTQEAVPFASVQITQTVNEQLRVVSGIMTSGDGSFTLDKLPSGQLTLSVTFVSYQAFTTTLVLAAGEIKDLGAISLNPDTKILTEVEVVGEKAAMELTPGKRVFNVANSLTAVGGTAEMLLRNVPSVTIDESGAATLRNMSATIYVNGKPTQLTLAQIPANQIASVEVISNPSARYDASTSGGIINLVLKKNRENGLNGLVSAGIGNNSRYDGTFNLDWKKGKWNITTLYGLNATKNPLNGYANRTTRDASGETESYFNQTTAISQNNFFQNGRVAADYNVNARNVLTIAGTLVGGAFNTSTNQQYTYRNAAGDTTGYGSRLTVPNNSYTNAGIEFDWKHTFEQKGRELSFTSSLTQNRISNAGDWYTTAYNITDGAPISQVGYPLTNRIDGHTTGTQLLAQLDYVHPASNSVKWEMGLRSFSYLRSQVYLFNEVQDGTKVLLQDYSQNAQIDETVNAVYGLYSNQLNDKLSLQAGLRLEQSFMHGLSHFDNSKFGYDYPSKTGQNIFQSFFPSFSVTRKIDENSEWNLNLSRKVGRPNFRHVFVGIMANDKQNITIGNPSVRPEFVNTAELNYNKSWNIKSGSLDWLATGYYIYEDHTIKPFTQPLESDSTILVTTFQNVKADIQYGVDNTLNFMIGPWSLLFNVNVFSMILQSTDINTQMLRYNSKLNVTYKFQSGFSAQVSSMYRSKSPSLQGYQSAMFGVDFAIRKSFLNNRASVGFLINDIFNSRKSYSYYELPTTSQETMSRRDIRYFKITLQVPLGKGVVRKTRNTGSDIDFSN